MSDPLTAKERRHWRRWFIRTCRCFGCSWHLTFKVASLWELVLDEIDEKRRAAA
jgi:hypothetical protein